MQTSLVGYVPQGGRTHTQSPSGQYVAVEKAPSQLKTTAAYGVDPKRAPAPVFPSIQWFFKTVALRARCKKAQCAAGLSIFRDHYERTGFAVMYPFTAFTQLFYETVHPL
ncbi:hypothetical protein ACI77J_21590 [Pseudomonas sp. O64]|uniref:hypothetical protein n=1 Tax=unclassified Pseudomonas TaxID=196821 RepID=UPI0021D8CA51|nr:hypothetical protein [Pseudomonas sp. YeP6b]